MTYAWIIDTDHLDGEAKGVKGPRRLDNELKQKIEAGKGKHFKMYDDDGKLYYSGRIVGDFEGFEPLDDFGTPNAGAVRIDFKNKNGEFETI